MSNLFKALSRRKTVADITSELARVLTLLDLTALGVGSTLGLGVYILAGSVAKTVAGPAVCLSFLVAAIASGLSGLCYAEFAGRIPRAGSAYVYSYVSVGEFVAYIIGWNLILESVIGSASVARGLSAYLNELIDNKIKDQLQDWMPMHIDFLAEYPDFLSCFFVMLLTVLLAIGVKESTRFNNIFTLLNLLTIGTVIVAGTIKADTYNWNIPKEKIPPSHAGTAGKGGFMPFGFQGVMEGAAKCFYGFVGFDAVATTGEEAKNPQRNIPVAIVISLIIIFFAYFSIATVLTLMWPYYDQNPNAPFPYVFEQVGWTTIKMIVTIGALLALCSSLLGAMFPLPRIIYAMSIDGLIYKTLARVHPRTQTPVIATLTAGVLSAVMATMFNLNQLIDMMSIGTLLAYTIVSVCVLILRYQPRQESEYPHLEMKKDLCPTNTAYSFVKFMLNLNMNKYPSRASSILTNWTIGIFSIVAAGFSGFLVMGRHLITVDHPFYFLLFASISAMLLILFIVIARQPQDNMELTFKVPWIPLLPCVSVIINLYLMLQLDVETWIRFIVWLLIGFLIYFTYGINESEEKKLRQKNEDLNHINIANESSKI